MTGNDFENLFRFLRVKLRPAGAQQDSFTPETESEHLAQQGVGMEDQVKGRRLTCEAIIFIILTTYRPVGC